MSYLDAWGSGWSGGAWHPRGPPHALTALQEPQGVTGAAGHPLVTPAEQGPDLATSPRDERCHHAATSWWHSPTALTFSAAGPGGPAGPIFPGKPGGP